MSSLTASSDLPLVSVVMPVYNTERYIADAIHSILAQTYSHFELIIVDDGSTDGSAAIVRDFAERDSRIRPIFAKHGGAYCARNIAIAAAHGQLVAHMDSDDVTAADRFASQLEWMRGTGVDICGGCAKSFGEHDHLWWFPESQVGIRHELVFRNALLHPTVMLRAEIARAHPYDETLLTMGDYELWTRLAPLYRLGNMPRIVHKWRSHARQTHVVMQSVAIEVLRKIRRRYLQLLLPQAAESDSAALARVAEKATFTDLADLALAGQWLARLAQTPDNYLRRHMAARWYAACLRSARLGFGVYALYHRVVAEFGIAPRPRAWELWLACALPRKQGLQLAQSLKAARHLARRSNDFA